ncbi:MAG: 30S ribosomal protein S20 [Pedosphaera sp.]|nr:30S ribosomal protein S20 [Pedosphaera sp.]PHX95522.1 MAG: 30S ribosomal protein S20 [Pedosphaera sp.]
MPNTKSAGRRMRNSARKQVRNTVVRTQVKTAVKKFRAAVESSLDTSPEVLRVAISTLDKAVKKGVIKRNTADRKKSRLTIALNKATAAAAAKK